MLVLVLRNARTDEQFVDVAVRELAEASRRVDNAALLGVLPDVGVDPAAILRDLAAERSDS